MAVHKSTILKHIHILKGDITKMEVDAIVNAANPSLLGGGGVDGAIHRAAGPQLLEECRTLGGAQPGEAKITKGYRLKAKHVIHTPGPVYRGGNHNEAAILKNSYYNSMRLAKDNGCKSIAFPAISTGVYGYPKDEACSIALKTIIEFMEKENFVIDVYFVLFDDENYGIYTKHLQELS